MTLPGIGRSCGLGGLLILLFLATTAYAGNVSDMISVNDPYVRAVPPVVSTSAAFMQLQNSGDKEYFVVGAETPAAGAVELHMHSMDDGMMRMRRIPHFHLPPGDTVKLQPGGLHIMLFDLKSTLKVGDELPISLIFDDGSKKHLSAVVRAVRGRAQH